VNVRFLPESGTGKRCESILGLTLSGNRSWATRLQAAVPTYPLSIGQVTINQIDEPIRGIDLWIVADMIKDFDCRLWHDRTCTFRL
jgi:hypothetical protein